MAQEAIATTGIGRHGAIRLPSVNVDSCNIVLKDDEGFLGDRASKGAFRKLVVCTRRHHGFSTPMTACSPSTTPTSGVALSRPARKKAPDLSKAAVWTAEVWRHADDEPTREGTVKKLVKILRQLIAVAEDDGMKLAPFIGMACPGVINADGSVENGAQNLPGNSDSIFRRN